MKDLGDTPSNTYFSLISTVDSNHTGLFRVSLYLYTNDSLVSLLHSQVVYNPHTWSKLNLQLNCSLFLAVSPATHQLRMVTSNDGGNHPTSVIIVNDVCWTLSFSTLYGWQFDSYFFQKTKMIVPLLPFLLSEPSKTNALLVSVQKQRYNHQ